jgi:hypothetical protein
MMLARAGVPAAVLAVATTLSGCGGSSAPTTAPQPTAPVPTTPAACPQPSDPKPVEWPSTVPADLPKPPNATIDDAETAQDGVRIVKFTTPQSLREAVLFVVRELPKAGYVLGRGDAEAAEADAPFVHNDIRGLLRMIVAGNCRTQWLLATVDTSSPAGGSPLLPAHTPSGSSSPLPFG